MPTITHLPATRQLNPDKLLLSKWTAVDPVNKEKHFMVTLLIAPQPPSLAIEMVQMEALYSGRRFNLPWRMLREPQQWLQGWV